MTRLGSGTQIQVAFWWQNKAFKWSKGSIQGALSACSNTLRSSETMLFVFLPISTKRLCLIRMWLSYASTITLWIVPVHTLWPVGSVQAAAQLQISYCEDGMHWLDSCSKICIVGGYFSGTLERGQMGDNLEFLVRFWVAFRCFVYLINTSVIFMHEGMCRVLLMLGLIVVTFVSEKRIMAVIGLRVVLATGPGNPPAVRVRTGKTVRFGSRTVQKPDPQRLGGPNPDP